MQTLKMLSGSDLTSRYGHENGTGYLLADEDKHKGCLMYKLH